MSWKYEMKQQFRDRMQKLMPLNEDFDRFEQIVHTGPRNFIRCNTLKIGINELVKRLSEKWNISQPFLSNREIILVESELQPGELGNSIEHLLGYYYIQEVSSMLSVIALNPLENEFVLDLCASPGSKTTQIAAFMNNKGTIIANDIKIDRISILSSNLERCGVTNCIVTRNDGVNLCANFLKKGIKFDRILLDAPCSGEGTLRSSPKTFLMWNLKMVKNMARKQKKLLVGALRCLKKGGTIVYSTCTHSPEENEGVVNFALLNFPLRVESIILPLKCRPGIEEWCGEKFKDDVKKCCRIYPQDNDSEGFFVAKMTLMEDIK